MAFRFRITIALTILVAALGWGLFIKTYMSSRGTELIAACVAPHQLLNFNLGQVNDIRLNLQVGAQKLTDLMTSIQEKSRELSALEARHQNLVADVALLNEQIEARRVASGQLPAPTAEVQPLTPSRACP